MLKYNYTLIRNEGDEIKEYKPNLIPTELDDLVYIQGPNSSGKSTLLNIIALGFFGEKLKADELNTALRERIEQLRNSKHQEIIFEIEINNKMLGKTIKSIKNNTKNKDFKVIEIVNGHEKIINSEDFIKEYKLIYDIPTDPTRRFRELLKEINSTQQRYEDGIIRLRQKIDTSIREIKEGQNPDRINELEVLISTLREEYNTINEIIIENEKTNRLYKQFHILREYNEYYEDLTTITSQIGTIQKRKTIHSGKNIMLSKKEQAYLTRINEFISRGIKLHNEVTSYLITLLPEQDNRLKLWKKIDCADEIKNADISNELSVEINYFKYYLDSLLKKENNNANESRFLKSLRELIEEFKNADILVPGTGKKINDFIKILNNEIDRKTSLFNKTENLELCIEKLELLEDNLEAASKDVADLKLVEKKKIGSDNFNEENDNNILEQLKTRKKDIEVSVKKYASEIELLGLNIKDYKIHLHELEVNPECQDLQTYTKIQLDKTIIKNEIFISTKKDDRGKIIKQLELAVAEKKLIEQRKPHKYQKYLKELEEVKKNVYALESKFSNDLQDNINMMSTINLDKLKLSDNQLKYAKKVSQFLAAKVGNIKHIDGIHEIEQVDTIDEVIITKTGKIISFNDLGTGQGQGAYLEALININENRKIIALFDEVAMMDSRTLQPIFDKLIDLYNQKRLLLAVIVQKKDDFVEVRSLIK